VSGGGCLGVVQSLMSHQLLIGVRWPPAHTSADYSLSFVAVYPMQARSCYLQCAAVPGPGSGGAADAHPTAGS
jgi:hypothetical protein